MKKEKWTSIVFLIFALITIYESIRLSVWERGSPTSGTFPFILGIILAFLSAIYFSRHLLKRRKKTVVDELKSQWTEESETVLDASKVDWKKVLYCMGAIAAYPFLFMMGGYVIGTAIFLFFMLKFVEQQRILKTLVITSIVIMVSYVIFGLFLKVPLH